MARAAGCPNEELRTGLSASLPDCRAYELVTPADSNGRLVGAINTHGTPPLNQVLPAELASPLQNSIAYMTYQSPLAQSPEPNGVTDIYVAERGAIGWETTRDLTPPGPSARGIRPQGISSDHRYSVYFLSETGPLVLNERPSFYLEDPTGSVELLGLGSLGSEPYANPRYIGENGEHIIFSTSFDNFGCLGTPQCKVLRLEPDAPPTGTGAIYDRSADGPTHVVSLLPGDVTPAAGQNAFFNGVSKDGTTVAFIIGTILYVRVPDLEDGHTLKVAEGTPTYAGLSDDGHFLFYIAGGEKGTIHRFDTETAEDVAVNPTAEGEVVNISADGSHVYFISEDKIGGEGELGKPNMYVWSDDGSPEYITTVASSDLVRTSGTRTDTPALTNWTDYVANIPKDFAEAGPGNDSSRSTPGGAVLVFESRAQLTPYDNGGHTEIYRYDNGDKSLICISCNLSVEPALGDAYLQEQTTVNPSTVIYNLTADGSRVFFETTEGLVTQDTDGVNDIYEWEKGEGETASINLISSGQSTEYVLPEGKKEPETAPKPNLLLSVTPDGQDVVFLSQDALVPGAPDGGSLAIYDARVGGGFAAPSLPIPCLEEGCKPTVASFAPSLPAPPSATTQGSNVKPHKPYRCHKAKRRKKPHCNKHKKNHSSNESQHTARATASPAEQEMPEGPRAVSDPKPGGSAAQRAASSTSSPSLSAANPFEGFGLEKLEAGESTSTAGAHPDFTIDISFNHTVNASDEPEVDATTKEISVSLPPGFLGNPTAVPYCTTGELVALNCPPDAQVGVSKVAVTLFPGEPLEPIYNLKPPHPDKEIARFGFVGVFFPVFIDVKVRTASDYGATATVFGPSGFVSLVNAETTLWGNPASPVHDAERLTPGEVFECVDSPCKQPEGKRSSTIPPADRKAFMTNPSACQPMGIDVAAMSYQLPGKVFAANTPMEPIAGCTGLPFAPNFEATPTSHVAGAPTGLNAKLVLPQHLGEEEKATAPMREARVTLPAGMQVAAGAANWIGTCSAAQVGFHEEVDAKCPDNSKLGTATVTSPFLPGPVEGAIYQRSPAPGHQLGLWLVVDALGLHIKLPGELEPDKSTGRLAAVFRDLPQVPVEEVALNVWGGPRAPLQNPDHCGTFTTDFTFAPHSQDPAVSGQSAMTINQGCNQGFDPKISVGVTNPVAGKFSPLVVDLTREDGNQALRGFEIALPDGELAKIKGVPLCPDAAAASASCPATSAIGHVIAASGPGPEPLWVPQPGKAEPKVYLAGPYGGSPFSVVTEVPAQAGPFDLGTLAVRSGLGLDPDTNRAVVKADPLPQFFEGIGLSYRRVHAVIDRPEFSLNPTDCSQLKSTSNITSTLGTVAHPTSPFQVEGCKALKFKPKLSLKLKGGTKRGSYPALTAVLKARKGDANIAKTSVGLPHSEFLAQEHIVTVCTRKQFAADKCPKGAIYGRAKAWTPLLAKPLSGPVYLRSSNHPLPDLVMAFGGELEVNIVGRIDSKNGGIRANFDSIPDAPITKFVMKMNGGKKSLLVNSTDICAGKHRATVRMTAQNGRERSFRPALLSGGCGAKKG